MFLVRVVLISVVAYIGLPPSWASNEDLLPRRGFLGARLAAEAEDGEASASAEAGLGVVVVDVFPGLAAAEAGLEKGDVLSAIGDVTLRGENRVAEAVKAIVAHLPGEDVPVAFERGGEKREINVRLQPVPEESHPDFDTIYGAVDAGGTLHRAILTKPRDKTDLPVVFYLQGLSCSSIDLPYFPDDPMRQLLNGLTKAGYATMRLEKRGVGDSQGAPCADLDFATELQGYEAALEYLAEQDFVDAENIFLFGHSMGGVFAPLLARDARVAGAIVYGTISKPMKEYFEENNRRQLGLRSLSEGTIEKNMETVREFIDLFFDQRLKPGEIRERSSRLKNFLVRRSADDLRFHGRHYTFWHQLDDIDLAHEWEDVDVPVLVVWGRSDVPASRGDHVLIAETVNASNSGQAVFLELDNIGHGFDTAADMRESLIKRPRGPFNSSIVDETVAWLNERSKPRH